MQEQGPLAISGWGSWCFISLVVHPWATIKISRVTRFGTQYDPDLPANYSFLYLQALHVMSRYAKMYYAARYLDCTCPL